MVFSTYQRIHVFTHESPIARPVLWSDEPPCDLEYFGDNRDVVTVPSVVGLGADRLGVFFHPLGATPGPTRYAVVTSDGDLVSDPITVGGDWPRWSSTVGGWQTPAVRLGDVVLFVEGYERADYCHVVRLMNLDGSHARNAPWQLPCFEDGTVATLSVELGTMGDVVVLAYSERRIGDSTLYVTAGDDWFERVVLVTLTAEGRLASDPVIVTEPVSTALLPIPRTESRGPPIRDFFVSLAAMGDEPPVVAWTDLRIDEPGVFAREVVCTPLSR